MVQNVIDKTTNSGTSSWDRQVYFNDAIGYWPWAQDISGSFDEFSAAVVPLPSGVLMGLAGLGIVAIRRRRH
ncbi:MAG: VPLPA-CTERM sorting domain-containing protein [Planctomycetota bacterium]